MFQKINLQSKNSWMIFILYLLTREVWTSLKCKYFAQEHLSCITIQLFRRRMRHNCLNWCVRHWIVCHISNSSKPQLKDNIIWFIAIKSSLTLWNLDVLIMIYPVIMQVLASKTKIYMVLEYVNGGELFDKIVRSNCLFIIHIHDDLLPNWQSQSMNYFVFTGIQR